MKTVIEIVIVAVIVWFIYNTFFHKDEWTLMVCETLMSDGAQCQDNAYKIPGFHSAKECLLAGVDRFSTQGFECGNNCHPSEYGNIDVCDEICNNKGCSK